MAARIRLTDSRRICSHSSELQWATAAVQEERTTTRSWGIFSPTWVNQSMGVSSSRARIVEGCNKKLILSRAGSSLHHKFDMPPYSRRRGIRLNGETARGEDVGQLFFALANLLNIG